MLLLGKMYKQLTVFMLVSSGILNKLAVCITCEHFLREEEGMIETPNYPENYPPSFSCVWTIITRKDHYIQLTFVDFDVEAYDDCRTDVLEVKDGGDAADPLIGILHNSTDNVRDKGGQYCNQRRPPKVITSTHNQLRLWFSSDTTIQLKGFRAKYKTIQEEGCGGEITAEYGEIASPRFPLHYPRDCQCEWKIRVPKGKYVALKFVFFEVETRCPTTGPCQCLDSVSLKDGHADDAKSLGTYCFASPPPIYTSGNELTVNFASDLYGRLQGFKAVFTQSSTERCGGDFNLPNGTISYPSYYVHALYPAFSDCIWTIQVASGEYIALSFVSMDVVASLRGDCSDDYIEVRDGSTSTSPILGRFCNADFPKVVVSTTNGMFIRFHSNEKNAGKGFTLMYNSHKKSCSASLGMEDSRIPKMSLMVSSTFKIAHKPYELAADYGRLNNHLAWCSQEHGMRVVGEYFQITFKTFRKITGVATQGYSMYGNVYYVTKYKLRYSTGEALKHYLNEVDASKGLLYTLFHGNHNYNISKTNHLSPDVVVKKIRIEPLDYSSGKRRHVCMRIEVYGCELETGSNSVVLTKSAESIQFRSYKKSSNIWILSPDAGMTNSVYIVKIKALEADCSHSKLRISTHGDSSSSNETYCNGRFTSQIFVRLSSQQLWVKFDIFTTPNNVQGLDFSYQQEDLGFGRLIKSLHGVISGEHHILSSHKNASVWLLKLPKGYRLKLEFERIHLSEDQTSSSKQKSAMLLIKSGLLESSSIVHKFSGYKQPTAFIYSKNELRIEYHSYAIIPANTREGFTLKYTALREGISSQIWN